MVPIPEEYGGWFDLGLYSFLVATDGERILICQPRWSNAYDPDKAPHENVRAGTAVDTIAFTTETIDLFIVKLLAAREKMGEVTT